MKIKKHLQKTEITTYASDQFQLLENGVDCSAGYNPYGYPKAVREVMKNFDLDRHSPYPHSQKAYEGIKIFWDGVAKIEKENIVLSDGSMAAATIATTLFAKQGAKVLGFAPQFSDYITSIILAGMDYHPIFLKKEKNYIFEVEEILKALTGEYSILYLDNPNNPTGQNISIEDMRRLFARAKALGVCVIADEAYGDFLGKKESATALLDEFDNLIVLRSLSKGFGLAGIRAGYCMGHKDVIACMKKIANVYMLGEMSREVLGTALTAENDLEIHMTKFAKGKKALREVMGNQLKMAYTNDRVPICLLIHENENIDLVRLFFEHGISTVPGVEFMGMHSGSVRIRLPREEDMPKLLAAVKKIND